MLDEMLAVLDEATALLTESNEALRELNAAMPDVAIYDLHVALEKIDAGRDKALALLQSLQGSAIDG